MAAGDPAAVERVARGELGGAFMKWLTRGRLLKHIDGDRIRQEIEAAEKMTSGEIRVSVAPLFWGNVRREAERAFDRLGMRNTRDRNGVLIFIVPSRRSFAILGDEGIDRSVGQTFWDNLAKILTQSFKSEDFTLGLIQCIQAIGEQLATAFPHAGAGDLNELPNDVDFGH